MIEREIQVTTEDGVMPTFVFHPEVDGPHPVVLYLMDAPGIRPALRDMASRLATAGYYVMLPYLYYRGGPFQEFGQSDEDMHRRQDLMGTITPTNIIPDRSRCSMRPRPTRRRATARSAWWAFACVAGSRCRSLVACQSGLPRRRRSTVRGSCATPPTLRIWASTRCSAEVHLAWVKGDPTAPAETIPVLRGALDGAGVRYTFDLVTGAQHGFAPPGGERYDRTASERHWERVHSLFRRKL